MQFTRCFSFYYFFFLILFILLYLTNKAFYMQMSHVTFMISELACDLSVVELDSYVRMNDLITINPNAKLVFVVVVVVRWNRFIFLIRFWCCFCCILLNEAFVARFKMQHLCESSFFFFGIWKLVYIIRYFFIIVLFSFSFRKLPIAYCSCFCLFVIYT